MSSDYLTRRLNKKQYKNEKISLALGLSLIEKKNVSIDIGLSAKRNPDIKKINPGVGASARLFMFTMGAYTYSDDVKVNLGSNLDPDTGTAYSTYYNSPTYQETFKVYTYTLGMSLGRLSLDMGAINTKYKFYPLQTQVKLYSASFQLGRWMFNLAQRSEVSSNSAFGEGQLLYQNTKNDIYYGAQYLLNKHVLVGVAYNNYLLQEVSMSMILFL